MSNDNITGYTFIRATTGDTFDLLAAQAYKDERKCHYIMQANPGHLETLVFQGGEVVRIPILQKVESAESQPPWRR